jgi:hypothetical protein
MKGIRTMFAIVIIWIVLWVVIQTLRLILAPLGWAFIWQLGMLIAVIVIAIAVSVIAAQLSIIAHTRLRKEN